ncbi:MAG: preprotein translocase subunit SecA, partial [Usitatibacter sp.]
IISGQAEDSTELYRRINLLIPKLIAQKDEKAEGDYWVDLKMHSVTLSEQGHEHAEELMAAEGLLPAGASLYDPSNIILMHHLHAGVRAHALYHRDQNYVVQNDEVVIVDEFTGRMMQGRRWSDGLHQAVEAKENVSIKNESQTLASITFQNYFRLYRKLAGMTGTADTEAFEFSSIYNLETVLIPTHRTMVRKDLNDQVFITAKEKSQAIINDVKERTARGQPVLLGTTSVENSELLSGMLEREKMPHNVLNAKQHAREAEIVAQAGRPKQITIATNMAGRGTDIVLGGNPDPEMQSIKGDEALSAPEKERRVADVRESWQKLHDEVVGAGGLHIIGSERHESRRIDNQLRGRSGRQGDPGSSRFFLSFEDPLLKIFAGERLQSIMRGLKIPEGEAIEARMVTRSIENAQRKVEARNFDIRKQLLEYDDVASDQRKVIYQQRNELLESSDISQTIRSIRSAVIGSTVQQFVPAESVEEQWDLPGLEKKLEGEFFLPAPVAEWAKADETLDPDAIAERVIVLASKAYDDKFGPIDGEVLHNYERAVMLQSIDTHWREHLAALDYLRQGIHLRGYAQKQPKQEYKREAFELFGAMLDSIKLEVTRHLMAVQVRSQAEVEEAERRAEESARALTNVQYQHADFSPGVGDDPAEQIADGVRATVETTPEAGGEPFVRSTQKVGRNDPCPCGSGKKYKQCHGRLA